MQCVLGHTSVRASGDFHWPTVSKSSSIVRRTSVGIPLSVISVQAVPLRWLSWGGHLTLFCKPLVLVLFRGRGSTTVSINVATKLAHRPRVPTIQSVIQLQGLAEPPGKTLYLQLHIQLHTIFPKLENQNCTKLHIQLYH